MPVFAFDTGGGDFEIAPPGSYAAVCTQIIDMGLQTNGSYGEKRRLLIKWELGETDSRGEPLQIAQSFTLSLSEKATLRRDLEAWRGRAFTKPELARFDLETLLGTACLISVVHATNGDKVFANVASIVGLPAGMQPPTPKGALLSFSCDDPDPDVLEKLSEKLRDKISAGLARLSAQAPLIPKTPPVLADLDDEIPW